jgi:hypothetical protein
MAVEPSMPLAKRIANGHCCRTIIARGTAYSGDRHWIDLGVFYGLPDTLTEHGEGYKVPFFAHEA